MKKILLTLFVLVFAYAGHTQDEILGRWVPPEGNTIVEMYKAESGDYAGKIVWLEKALNNKGEPVKDRMNPDKKLRDRGIMGMDMLENLTYEGGKWYGTLYSPKKGRIVNAELSLRPDNNLDILVSFRGFTKKIEWTKSELPK